MTTEEMVLKVLRAQSWERAKGELRSLLHTFFDDKNFEELNNAIEGFINLVEDNGLVE